MKEAKWQDIPEHIQEEMLKQQEAQGNKRDASVFEKHIYAGGAMGGFDWDGSDQGNNFWADIINRSKFGRLPAPIEKEESDIVYLRCVKDSEDEKDFNILIDDVVWTKQENYNAANAKQCDYHFFENAYCRNFEPENYKKTTFKFNVGDKVYIQGGHHWCNSDFSKGKFEEGRGFGDTVFTIKDRKYCKNIKSFIYYFRSYGNWVTEDGLKLVEEKPEFVSDGTTKCRIESFPESSSGLGPSINLFSHKKNVLPASYLTEKVRLINLLSERIKSSKKVSKPIKVKLQTPVLTKKI